MHDLVNGFGSRCAVRLAVAAAAAGLLAGCSSDVTRFSENPFSNPFNTASAATDKSPVGSIRQPGGPAAQTSSAAIESRPLAAPAVARYAAPATPSPRLVAQNSPAFSPVAAGNAAWSAVGGTPIVVARGETVGMLAARYGVPTEALLRSNGFRSAAEVRPGTRLVIPVYNAAAAAAHPQRQSRAVAQAGTKDRILPTRTIWNRQVADRGRTGRTVLHFVKGPQPVNFAQREAAARSRPKPSRFAAERPTTRVADGSGATKPMKPGVVEKPAHALGKGEVADLRKPGGLDSTTTGSLPPAAKPVPKAAAAEIASLGFRWPAHGRIIQSFKAGGNDGINIAVPQGTAVKAVEDGVVAYAGNELKGYGNLVLIRHPNGFVSAYADNESIMVKRGETVKRGQVIAKSGDTGNVASPQLHFELRKGSTPVDPMRYLAKL